MNSDSLHPVSKLPNTGTTIFTQMSALVQQHGAINLSQGFPDFDGPTYLQERLAYYVAHGHNQYAPMTGVPTLRTAIADKVSAAYGCEVDADTQVTVTAGATEALYAAITALVRNGDEVIIFDPSYDSYAPAVELNGGVVKRVTMQPPAFHIDWQQVASLLTERTRLVILNTPHNPSATVLSRADLDQLWRLVSAHEIYVLSDEVYEHICFAPQGHVSVLSHPALRSRAVAVYSFGKTFHITGWKVGYCISTPAISSEIRKVHQYLTFAVNTPAQLAIADMLKEYPQHYQQLPEFFQAKRDFFMQALGSSQFELLPCAGTYFLLADYSHISDMDDVSFCRWLTTDIGVAAIPLSVFCADAFPYKLIRLCFAKSESTLQAAAERLSQL